MLRCVVGVGECVCSWLSLSLMLVWLLLVVFGDDGVVIVVVVGIVVVWVDVGVGDAAGVVVSDMSSGVVGMAGGVVGGDVGGV